MKLATTTAPDNTVHLEQCVAVAGRPGCTCLEIEANKTRDMLASVGTDASPLEQAAKRVLREALDRVELHPCDEGNDAIAAKQLTPELQALLEALKGMTTDD